MVTFRNNNNNRRVVLDVILEILNQMVITLNLVLIFQIMIILKEKLQEEITTTLQN